MELIQIQSPGLVALYNTEDPEVKRQAPVVGYLRTEDGSLVVAIAGDGAKIIPANTVKGYCGLKWSIQTTVNRKTTIGTKGDEWEGVSAFERIFGKGIFR